MHDAFRAALRASLPSGVRRLSSVLAEHGHRSWAVGGSVRDVLAATRRGDPPRSNADWDFATDALPEQVTRCFRRVVPTGIAHGTVTVLLDGESYEVTTLRGERGFSDGRRPDEVFFVDDLALDLARRDFTVNAIAYSIEDDELHDPFGGIEDLERGLLRAVGAPLERFSEDGLRVLRAARFCSTLGMEIEAGTRAAIRPSRESFARVSRERVRDEWWKALRSATPSRCFRVQLDEGLLEVTAPELFAARNDGATVGVEERALASLDRAPADPLLRFGLLLAAGIAEAAPDRPRIAFEIAARLKLPNVERDRVTGWIRHERGPSDETPRALRAWLADLGRKEAAEILPFLEFQPTIGPTDLVRRATAELASGHPLELRELALGGKDLIAAGRVRPGPEVGRALGALFAHVLGFPEDNVRERLLARLDELERETDPPSRT